jgi:hypothetical protein
MLDIQEESFGSTEAGEPRKHPLRDIAARDVRGLTTEEEVARLRSPEWVEHWFLALMELRQDVETQLAERKAAYDLRQVEVRSLEHFDETWAPYRAEYFGWKKHAVRFLNTVRSREREARQLKAELKQAQYVKHNAGEQERERERRREVWRIFGACRAFLEDEENITYKATPQRDELLADMARLEHHPIEEEEEWN